MNEHTLYISHQKINFSVKSFEVTTYTLEASSKEGSKKNLIASNTNYDKVVPYARKMLKGDI